MTLEPGLYYVEIVREYEKCEINCLKVGSGCEIIVIRDEVNKDDGK